MRILKNIVLGAMLFCGISAHSSERMISDKELDPALMSKDISEILQLVCNRLIPDKKFIYALSYFDKLNTIFVTYQRLTGTWGFGDIRSSHLKEAANSIQSYLIEMTLPYDYSDPDFDPLPVQQARDNRAIAWPFGFSDSKDRESYVSISTGRSRRNLIQSDDKEKAFWVYIITREEWWHNFERGFRTTSSYYDMEKIKPYPTVSDANPYKIFFDIENR